MDTFRSDLNEWIVKDDLIAVYEDKLRVLKDDRDTVTDRILDHVESEHKQSTVVRTEDGEITFKENIQPASISFRMITKCLERHINDPKSVATIISTIRSARTEQQKRVLEIERKFKK